MPRTAIVAILVMASTMTPSLADWRVDVVQSSGRVTAVETSGGEVVLAVGAAWYRLAAGGNGFVPFSLLQ